MIYVFPAPKVCTKHCNCHKRCEKYEGHEERETMRGVPKEAEIIRGHLCSACIDKSPHRPTVGAGKNAIYREFRQMGLA